MTDVPIIFSAPMVRALDREPPDIRRDRNCPLHGIDPDRARDDAEDRP